MENKIKKTDVNDFLKSAEEFKNTEEFKSWISTDEQNEFVDNFWTMTDFYKKFLGGEKRYFKRTIISLHMTLNSLFILFLHRCSGTIAGIRKDYIHEKNTPNQNINIVNKYKGSRVL